MRPERTQFTGFRPTKGTKIYWRKTLYSCKGFPLRLKNWISKMDTWIQSFKRSLAVLYYPVIMKIRTCFYFRFPFLIFLVVLGLFLYFFFGCLIHFALFSRILKNTNLILALVFR